MCLLVCVCVRGYVPERVYMCVRVCVSLCMCLYLCVDVCLCVCVFMCVLIHACHIKVVPTTWLKLFTTKMFHSFTGKEKF